MACRVAYLARHLRGVWEELLAPIQKGAILAGFEEATVLADCPGTHLYGRR
jgi:hypothetical protein